MKSNWNHNFIELAKTVSTWSKDPSTQVGAVAVGAKRQILSTGYNGFPRGIEDSHERLHTRETKLSLVVHAEQNLIYNACYNGVSLDGSTVYLYGLPVCSDCCKGLVQTGISRLVMSYPEPKNTAWLESFNLSKDLLTEAGIEYKVLDGF